MIMVSTKTYIHIRYKDDDTVVKSIRYDYQHSLGEVTTRLKHSTVEGLLSLLLIEYSTNTVYKDFIHE